MYESNYFVFFHIRILFHHSNENHRKNNIIYILKKEISSKTSSIRFPIRESNAHFPDFSAEATN